MEDKNKKIKKTTGENKKTVKKTGRGGGTAAHKPHLKSPMMQITGQHLPPGENRKNIELNAELFNLPQIDMKDPDQVMQRLNEYFAIYAKYDYKPTVAGMGLALNGISRQTLWAIANRQDVSQIRYKVHLPDSVCDLIQKAYKFLENSMENWMISGKVNPIVGIFMSKNHYGYQDKTEHIISPNYGTEELSAEEIKKRYRLSDEN